MFMMACGVALCASHGVGDAPAALGVLNPELADGGVGVAQGEFSALGVGEAGAVEVELQALFLGPLNPALEVLDFHLVAVNELASEVAIDLVEVQAVVAGEQALGEADVGSHFLDVAGASGVVARCLYASAEGFVALETHHVVSLPAMQADGCLFEQFDGFVGVNADGGIAFFGNLVGFTDEFFFHRGNYGL